MASSALFSDQDIQDAGGKPLPAAASSPSLGDTLFSGDDIKNASTPAPPTLSPEEQSSQTRQMLVSGLTGMPTPNMNAQDRAQFEKGKAAGAISVPGVAGAATGATAAAEALPSVLPHTLEGIKAIGSWASKNPVSAYALYNLLRDLVPGAKKAIGLIHGAPVGE